MNIEVPRSPESPVQEPKFRLHDLLIRPGDQRLREYKYRFSQAAVFGLPVLALQWKGHMLGGAEADRWVGILQALLAGWVVYVGAAGMLFEGLILLPQRVMVDLVPALVAILAYLYSLVAISHVMVDGTLWYRPLLFHLSVVVIGAWTGIQWFRWSRKLSSGAA